MPLLVDGMNVIGSRPDGWWKDRHAAMVRLVDMLERWATDRGELVAVVFERPPSPPIASTVIDVASAPRPHRDSADDEIVRRVSADPQPDKIRVVTSDQGLAERVRAIGAAVEPANAFRRLLETGIDPAMSDRRFRSATGNDLAAADDVSIRRLDPADVELVEPLWGALREHHASVSPHLGAPRAREDSWSRRRAQYERWLSEPDAFLLIAELGDTPVGYAMVHLRAGSPTWPSSERAGEVETLSVHPDKRGRGIGTMLLHAVESELAGLGVDELSLHVVSTNHQAMAFYERHGLRPFAQWLSVAGIRRRQDHR